MEIRFTPVHEHRLELLAAMAHQTVDELEQAAVAAYLRHIESLTAAVKDARASADRDGWLTHRQVFAGLDKRLLKCA